MAGVWYCCLLLTSACLPLAVSSSGTNVGRRSSSRAARGEVRISSEVRTAMLCRLNEDPVCGSSVHMNLIVARMELDERRGRHLFDATAAPIQALPIATPDTSTPTIVTVPGSVPVFYPPENPINPSATPITVPGAVTQPVTNPVTTYPSPPASFVPVTAPLTNPVGPPAMTNEPATPGQSWCVTRTGVADSVLQEAIDYACGLGGADCSQIQQGASCYIPSTLQNHASYAFNSYYQRNPVATSCDFGGSAVIVNSNPSTGSCVYLNSASVATPETVATPSTSTPTRVSPLTSSGTPAEVVNPVTGIPSGFTTESPQAMNSSTYRSISSPLSLHVIFLTSLLSAMFMVRMGR